MILLNYLLKSTWILPILLAILAMVGLVGALVYEGTVDLIYVTFLASALLPIAAVLLKNNRL